MRTVFYSAIRPAIGQTVADVIRQANRMGFSMVIFNGWTDADLGRRFGDGKGPRRDEADANQVLLMEIQDACAVHTDDGDDFPHIVQTVTDGLGEDYKIA